MLSRYDVTDWKAFAAKLSRGGDEWTAKIVAARIFSRLSAEAKKAIQEIAGSAYPSNYARRGCESCNKSAAGEAEFLQPLRLGSDSSDIGNRAIAFTKPIYAITSGTLST